MIRVVEDLERAAALVEKMTITKQGNVLVALDKATKTRAAYLDAFEIFYRSLGGPAVTDWDVGRSREEIVAAFRKAAATVRGKEQR